MNLKSNLRRLLFKRDLTAAQLSRMSGVPKTTLADWLAGGNPRDLTKLKLVADVLRTTVDELCFGDGSSKTEPIENYIEEVRAGVFEIILRKPQGRRTE